jgi:hypothetical protein
VVLGVRLPIWGKIGCLAKPSEPPLSSDLEHPIFCSKNSTFIAKKYNYCDIVVKDVAVMLKSFTIFFQKQHNKKMVMQLFFRTMLQQKTFKNQN